MEDSQSIHGVDFGRRGKLKLSSMAKLINCGIFYKGKRNVVRTPPLSITASAHQEKNGDDGSEDELTTSCFPAYLAFSSKKLKVYMFSMQMERGESLGFEKFIFLCPFHQVFSSFVAPLLFRVRVGMRQSRADRSN